MIKIEGIDFELPQMGREPKMGYADEFIEKTMISGKIRRIYKGKRFFATFSYAYLQEGEIATLNSLLEQQRQQGYLNAEIDTPFGSYTGGTIIELNNQQSRFKYDRETNSYVWTNWQISLKAIDYDT